MLRPLLNLASAFLGWASSTPVLVMKWQTRNPKTRDQASSGKSSAASWCTECYVSCPGLFIQKFLLYIYCTFIVCNYCCLERDAGSFHETDQHLCSLYCLAVDDKWLQQHRSSGIYFCWRSNLVLSLHFNYHVAQGCLYFPAIFLSSSCIQV